MNRRGFLGRAIAAPLAAKAALENPSTKQEFDKKTVDPRAFGIVTEVRGCTVTVDVFTGPMVRFL